MCFLGFEKIPVKSKKAQDKFKNPTSSRLGSVPVKKVPSGGVPVRGGSQQPPVRRVAPVSPGVGVRPVQQAGRGVPVRMVAQGSVPVRPDYLRSQASIGRVYSGGVAVRSVPGQPQVRRAASVPSGVSGRPLQQTRRTVPVRMVVVRKPASTPAGSAVPDNGLGLTPINSVSDGKPRGFRNPFGAVRDTLEDFF